uniref:Uncharacterized protein n=1 Tax=Electrophorus electricus TaxID=8005 RepID=A0AAY5EGK1_ELEEL
MHFLIYLQVTKHLHERWNVSQKVSAAEPPQRNALYDHGSALLRDAIKQLVAERQVEWADFLEQVVALFRTAVNPATKFTPYFLMFNRKASVPGEMKLDLLSYEQRPGGYTLSEEADSFFLSTLQEHQSQLKQTVFSNMNAAYKQEKKSAKRRSRNISSITLTVTEPLCPPDECPSPKKLRDGLFVTFPVETVLGTVQAAPEDRKNGLEYPLH